MTTQEWFEWKHRLDPSFVIPSKEEQDKYEAEERLKWETQRKAYLDKIKKEEEEQRNRIYLGY